MNKLENLVQAHSNTLVFLAANPALDGIKKLLTWFFGAGSIGLIIVGIVQIAKSMAESNGGQRTRGIMLIIGGLLLGGATLLVNLLSAPPTA